MATLGLLLTATGLPESVLKGSQLPDGSDQISATGSMYRGPGAGANGPFHHYVFGQVNRAVLVFEGSVPPDLRRNEITLQLTIDLIVSMILFASAQTVVVQVVNGRSGTSPSLYITSDHPRPKISATRIPVVTEMSTISLKR